MAPRVSVSSPPQTGGAPRQAAGGEAVPTFWSILRRKLLEPRSPERRAALSTLAFRLALDLVTFPFVVVALFHSGRIDGAYDLTWSKRFRLAWRMYRNSFGVATATSYKAHLAMAVKLFEVPRSVEGVVVECGSYLGGSAANLSLACELAGRQLIVYDSFEGMPPPTEGDKYADPVAVGAFRGSIDTVRATIARAGAPDRCELRPGWFHETLPEHREPIVLLFADVDWQASLHECLTNLWPHLVDSGWMFIDEYVLLDYCAVFFSERYWREYFDTTPPGLFGAGTGVPIGNIFVGPWLSPAPYQAASSIAYTWKGSSGHWDFYPSD